MQKTYLLTAVLLAISLFYSSAFAVNTARIDVVRSKETLADSDTKIIEEFLAEFFTEFFMTTDFSDIASLRAEIVSRSTSEMDSGQFQYGPRFFVAIKKEMSETLQKVNALPQGHHKILLTTNLLIIINDLANLDLSKLAVNYLKSPEVMIRYWAVNCVSNEKIRKQLNMTDSQENVLLAQEYVEKLQAIAQNEQSGDIVILLANFAADLDQPSADDMLDQIAQERINLYLNWQVENEMIDENILAALAKKVQSKTQKKAMIAKDFAVLYSLIIQRCVIGEEVLSPESKQNLISVIMQSEKYITQFAPGWQGSLKRAIERGGGATLLTEHDTLFGSATQTGILPAAAGFDYGKTAGGAAKTAPPMLSKPPAQ
ncbi:MAG: hypothetical protein JW806_06170 [Sedimentisphaerales bacterium]|nr:hypothetical protein [Sedimentisphaerales bacterium]